MPESALPLPPRATPTPREPARRGTLAVFAGTTLLVAVIGMAIQLGAVNFSAAQLWQAVNGQGTEHAEHVIIDLRLPRAFVAALVGVQFAVSGWLLQLLTRNPLAEAGILGISSGASLVAVLAFILGDWLFTDGSPYTNTPLALESLPLFAMAGGLLAAAGVYRLALRQGALSPIRLTLTGAVIAGMLHALTTGSLAFWGHAHTELVAQWLAGSLYGTKWQHLFVLLPWTLLGLASVAVLLKPLHVMQLDDEHARTLGLNLNAWRGFALLVAAVLAASAVGIVGPVGFIGLLVPHIVRRLTGPSLTPQLIACIILGAILTVSADLAGRTLFAPYEVPVGIISAVLGVPFFLFLLSRQP